MAQSYSISDGLCASCLVVKSTHAFVEVLLFERRLVLSHHLAEVVEESTKFQEIEVDSAAKRFWNEAVAEEEAESDLSTWLYWVWSFNSKEGWFYWKIEIQIA